MAPKRARACDGGVNTGVTRNQVNTWARDLWVAARMLQTGQTGPGVRQQLKKDYTALGAVAKANHLTTVFPKLAGHLRNAGQALLDAWTSSDEAPLIADEEAATSYRGCGTMFRYSGTWSRVSERSLEELLSERGANAIDDVCLALRQHPDVCRIWEEFQQFFFALCKKCNIDRCTLAMELHTHVSIESGCPSVHLHAMFDAKKTVAILKPSLLFRSCMPYISSEAPRGRGRCLRTAYNQGHYYLQCPKIGNIFMTTTCKCYDVVAVSPEWVTQLWQCQKLTSTEAEKEYIKCKRNIKAYVDNVKMFQRKTEEQHVHLLRARAYAALEPLRKRPRRLDIVEREFLPQFSQPHFRRRFLVLDGPSKLGKTLYAHSLCGPGATFETNCANTLDPDLRDFSPVRHKCILFDECCPSLVIRHKKLFQGPVDPVAMGQSATNCHAYSIFVHNVMMVCTCNSWCALLDDMSLEDREWIQSNQILVQCQEKLYEEEISEP